MSPPPHATGGERRRFPRVSGDEPAPLRIHPYQKVFSPRERG